MHGGGSSGFSPLSARALDCVCNLWQNYHDFMLNIVLSFRIHSYTEKKFLQICAIFVLTLILCVYVVFFGACDLCVCVDKVEPSGYLKIFSHRAAVSPSISVGFQFSHS